MKLTYDRSDRYLLDTEVENIFINEYMVTAPGEYVKVYLYALMCAQMGQALTFAEIGKQLQQSEEEVRKAFVYWKELGAVRVFKSGNDDIVEFASLRSNLFYGSKKNEKREISSLCSGSPDGNSVLRDEKLVSMYNAIEKIIGRPLGGKEPVEICGWVDDYGATPQLIEKAYKYCMERRKKDSAAYVGKVVKEWALKGLLTEEAIEEHLEATERMHFLYRQVFKALGFHRNATIEERRIMDVWFDDMGLSIDKVLEACKKTSGISNPNINYVDKVLKNQYKEQGGVIAGEETQIAAGIVLKYYDYIREREEAAAKERESEIYEKLPEIKALDEEIRQTSRDISRLMISAGANKKEAVSELRANVDRMLASKAATLTENGYPMDYMEVRVHCKHCNDTGTTENGERCSCFAERTEEAKEWQSRRTAKTNSL